MNDQPRVREGFIDDSKPTAKPDTPKIPRPAPPPVLEPSPADKDQEAPPEETWPIVVKLVYSKNLKNDKGEIVHELSFREPRGGDINRYGNPCRVSLENEIITDERKMHYIMAALCGILPPLLEAIDPRDWNTCAWRLRGFFLPDLRQFMPPQMTE